MGANTRGVPVSDIEIPTHPSHLIPPRIYSHKKFGTRNCILFLFSSSARSYKHHLQYWRCLASWRAWFNHLRSGILSLTASVQSTQDKNCPNSRLGSFIFSLQISSANAHFLLGTLRWLRFKVSLLPSQLLYRRF